MLKLISRPIDTVIRFGGEEFVIIFPETNITGGVMITQRIQQSILNIENLAMNPKILRELTLSIGIATNKLIDNITTHQIIELADKAMYQTKNNGRNQICYLENETDNLILIQEVNNDLNINRDELRPGFITLN